MRASFDTLANTAILTAALLLGWAPAASAQLGGVGDAVGDIAGGLGGATEGLGGITDGISGTEADLGGITGGLGGTDLRGITDDLGSIEDGLGGLTDGLDGITDSLGGVTDSLDGISAGLGGFTDGLGGLSGRLDGLLNDAGGLTGELKNGVLNGLTGLNVDPGLVDDVTGSLSDVLGVDLPALAEVLDLSAVKHLLSDILRRLQQQNVTSGVSKLSEDTDLHEGWINPRRFQAPFDAAIRDLNTTIIALQAIHTPEDVLPGMAYSKSGSAQVGALLAVARIKMERDSPSSVILGQTLFIRAVIADLPDQAAAAALTKISTLLSRDHASIEHALTGINSHSEKLELSQAGGILKQLNTTTAGI